MSEWFLGVYLDGKQPTTHSHGVYEVNEEVIERPRWRDG